MTCQTFMTNTCPPEAAVWPDRWVSSALVLHFFKTKSWSALRSPVRGSPTAQQVKNPLAMQETQETTVQFLGREDPRRRYWQPTLEFLPEKSHGQRILAGDSPMNHGVGYNWMSTSAVPCLQLHWLPVFHYELKRLTVIRNRDFTGGAVVKNSPASELDTALIPGQEDHTCQGAAKPTCLSVYRVPMLQLLKPTCLEPLPPQEKPPQGEAPAHCN